MSSPGSLPPSQTTSIVDDDDENDDSDDVVVVVEVKLPVNDDGAGDVDLPGGGTNNPVEEVKALIPSRFLLFCSLHDSDVLKSMECRVMCAKYVPDDRFL